MEYKSCYLKDRVWDLPSGPVAKTPCCQCRGLGFIPGQGTSSHMPQQKNLHATTKIKILSATTKTQQSQITIFFKGRVYKNISSRFITDDVTQ